MAADYRYPDRDLPRPRDASSCGGLTFELQHARGETDDHTWVWVPERRCSAPATSSSGRRPTRATRRRSSATRASGRRRCGRWRRSAPSCCCPATACRSSAPSACAQALIDTAELLESLVEQTLALMNAGARLDEIIHAVQRARRTWPSSRTCSRSTTSRSSSCATSGGSTAAGTTATPPHLKPAPEAELATALAGLAGGAAALAEPGAAQRRPVTCGWPATWPSWPRSPRRRPPCTRRARRSTRPEPPPNRR